MVIENLRKAVVMVRNYFVSVLEKVFVYNLVEYNFKICNIFKFSFRIRSFKFLTFEFLNYELPRIFKFFNVRSRKLQSFES